MKQQTATSKFSAKRQEIIDEASRAINLHGVAGLSSTEVAEAVGLTHNSFKYYFRRKNDLVHACYDQTFDRLNKMLDQARVHDTPAARVTAFLDISYTRIASIATGSVGRFLRIADLRAIDEPERTQLTARFDQCIEQVMALFGDEGDARDREIRAFLLWEITRSLAVWLPLHDRREFERIRRHFIPMLMNGLAPVARIEDHMLPFAPVASDPAVEAYLKAATRLINDIGYRGASVTKIASQLNVTKGGFYHHVENKLDLVFECFDRTFSLLENILDAAEELEGSHLDRLTAIAYTIFELQLAGDEPLLRISSVYASPPGLPQASLERLSKMTLRLSGFFVEGMVEGSIPPLDPNIASHIMLSLLNASHEISAHLPDFDRATLTRDCLDPIFNGLMGPAR